MFSPIEWFIFSMGIYWIAFALLFVAAGVFDFINFFLFVLRYRCTGVHWRNNAHRQKKWNREAQEKANALARNGFKTRVRITFVDKNYSILVK